MSDQEDRDTAGGTERKEAEGKKTSSSTASARKPQSAGRAGERPGSQKGSGGSRTGMLVVVALLVGGAGGWFAKLAYAQTPQSASEGGAGACGAWEAKICDGVGSEALACFEAKAAANLLSEAACDAALNDVPDTLARVAASRETCNTIVEKLCADLGAESPTCGMVREKTELFPAERCKEMLESYDEVLGELRMLEQQMGQQMGQPPMGQPPVGQTAPAPGSEAPGTSAD